MKIWTQHEKMQYRVGLLESQKKHLQEEFKKADNKNKSFQTSLSELFLLVETVLSNQKNEFFCSGVFFVEFLPAFETVSNSIPNMPKGSTANLISSPLTSKQFICLFSFIALIYYRISWKKVLYTC